MREDCKVLSFLLHYPDGELWENLPELAQSVEGLPQGAVKEGLRAALEAMRLSTLLALQQTYTAAFDVNPETTLNMAYHLHGNSEKRAAALVKLRQAYEQAGYECTSAELPDYLPLMLEFLAECPDEKGRAVVGENICDLMKISGRLQQTAPVYAELLRAAGAMLQDAGATSAPADRK